MKIRTGLVCLFLAALMAGMGVQWLRARTEIAARIDRIVAMK